MNSATAEIRLCGKMTDNGPLAEPSDTTLPQDAIPIRHNSMIEVKNELYLHHDEGQNTHAMGESTVR
jgi:hypothetical protein